MSELTDDVRHRPVAPADDNEFPARADRAPHLPAHLARICRHVRFINLQAARHELRVRAHKEPAVARTRVADEDRLHDGVVPASAHFHAGASTADQNGSENGAADDS